MFCQVCGLRNPDDEEFCGRCHSKLLVLSGVGVVDEATGETQEEIPFDEHLLERISTLEDIVKRTGEALKSVLETIGNGYPVLLIVDDLHAARPALLGTLRQLAGRITGAAVLVLALGRSELIDEPGSWPADGLLPLGPLSADEARRFLATLTEVAAHQAGLTDRIVERAGGNPFFLEQLAAITGQPGAGQQGNDALPPKRTIIIMGRYCAASRKILTASFQAIPLLGTASLRRCPVYGTRSNHRVNGQ